MRYLLKFFDSDQVSVLLIRNNLARLLKQCFISIILVVCGKVSYGLASGTYQSLSFISKMVRNQGLKGAVLYMKSVCVAIQQTIGGHRLEDIGLISGPRISRTRKGLPRCIPRNWRRSFYVDPKLIRLTLSIFSLYRVVSYKGKLSLSTITSLYDGIPGYFLTLVRYIPAFFRAFRLRALQTPNRPLSIAFLLSLKRKLFPILTASPGAVKGSWATDIKTLYATFGALESAGLSFCLKQISLLTGNIAWLELFQFFELTSALTPRFPVGRLGIKEEAAGKVRVFAMVDAWTQWVLYPIHKYIFKLLRRIPMDGTFNQLGPLSRIPWGQVPLFSLDLSAATDRLPIDLQIPLLDYIFPGLGPLWRKALVGRDYVVPQSGGLTVKYAVGQPMGALSSWAMLALTHHFIVQVSAWRAGVTRVGVMFKQYALLGDDILFWNALAAKEYVKIMTSLGVKMGLHKSLLSGKGTAAEFAKRTFYHGADVSAVSLKELSASLFDITALVGFGSKYGLSLAKLVRIAGRGYNVTGSLNKPFQSLGLLVKAILVCQLKPLTFETFQMFIGRVNATSFRGVDTRSLAIFSNYMSLTIAGEINETIQRSFLKFHDSIMSENFDFGRYFPDQGILTTAALESAAKGYFMDKDLALDAPAAKIYLPGFQHLVEELLMLNKIFSGRIKSPDLFYNMRRDYMEDHISQCLFFYWKGNDLMNRLVMATTFEKADVLTPRFGVQPKMLLTYNRWSKILFPLLHKEGFKGVKAINQIHSSP